MPVTNECPQYHGDDNTSSAVSAIVNASLLANASISTNQGPIKNIPDEMLSAIMSHLPPCFAACLGLTCSKFYSEFKHQHREPIKLETLLWDPEDESITMPDRKMKLHHLIGGWINKDQKYFYHDMHLTPCWDKGVIKGTVRPPTSNYITQSRECVGGRFLLTKVYAPSSFGIQRRLRRLREAYDIYTELVQEDEDGYPQLIPRSQLAEPIPSPCNVGDYWFMEFFLALANDWMITPNRRVFFNYDGILYALGSAKVVGKEDDGKIENMTVVAARVNVPQREIYAFTKGWIPMCQFVAEYWESIEDRITLID